MRSSHSATTSNNDNGNDGGVPLRPIRRPNFDPPGEVVRTTSRAAAPAEQQQQQQLSSPPPAAAGSISSQQQQQQHQHARQPTKTGRPGAYQVVRTSAQQQQQQQPQASNVYRVEIPAGVRPGTEFTVRAGNRRVRVACPETSRPGQRLEITLPPETVTTTTRLRTAPLTAAADDNDTESSGGGGGALPMTPEVRRINQRAAAAGQPAETHLVTIPPNIYPGMQFTAVMDGARFQIKCPEAAGPGMQVRVVKPAAPPAAVPVAAPATEIFEVVVPDGVPPLGSFALRVNGQRVLVTRPPNVAAGQAIRFELPASRDRAVLLQLEYEHHNGWKRTLRSTDLKFQWIRVARDPESADGKGKVVDDSSREFVRNFSFDKMAYVRQIHFLEGNDARLRTGTVELVPASEAVVDSHLVDPRSNQQQQQQSLVSYADISRVQSRPLREKKEWFDGVCQKLQAPWEDGHVKIGVRRGQYLLLDSKDAVLALSREDMRRWWRVEFLGEQENDAGEFAVEPAVDAGGPSKEWFELVATQIFDPAFGLFVASTHNQACVDINPGSAISCPSDHLIFFRFVGRFIGRALFNRQLIKTAHLTKAIYKHLLGWPITFEDIKTQGETYYESLKQLTTLDDVSMLYLNFTATEECLGVRQDVPLIEGGADTGVTNENLPEYLEATLRYRMFQRTKPQLTEILLGFFDIIPEPLLTVFDASELELILCGLPEIGIEDWQSNTSYDGLFEAEKENHQVVQWFWGVVRDDFDQEMRARLLQFATATSSVPLGGFACLLDFHGEICNFTIRGVDSTNMLPGSSTCFNRIYLPNYESRDILLEKLRFAVLHAGTGFGYE